MSLDEHRLHSDFIVNTTGDFSRFDQVLVVQTTWSGEHVTKSRLTVVVERCVRNRTLALAHKMVAILAHT